jgi:CRISPR-associated protein Csb1
LNWQKIARAIFYFDINALLHGVFLANLEDGRVKMPRSISAFIEAKGVREVVSGGTKSNPIDPTGKLRAKNFDKDVYGNVPYQRVEFSAESITAYFNLDLGLLRSYALGQEAFELLVLLTLYKTRAFLDGGTRLRTACDLKTKGSIVVTEPEGFVVPEEQALIGGLTERILSCKPMFADPPITEIKTPVLLKKGKEPEVE